MSDQDPSQDVTKVVPTPVEPPMPIEPVTPVAPVQAEPLQPAPVQPVATSTGAPRQSRGRWAIAIGAAALVIAITAGVVFALVGRSPDATVLGYVPSGTVVYGEVRLDLPGDQRHAVGEFLSHFPGFADQTALDTKLDEVLDQLVTDATNDKQTFTRDIKPWFDGELAFSVGPLPDPTKMLSPGSGSTPDLGHGLALLSIKDAAGAQAWFDDAIKASGATTTTETYGGATLTVFGAASGPQAAFAILDGKVAVAGDITSVKAAVDTKGDGGFSTDPDAKAALDSSSGDHIGFVYVALKPLMDWSNQLQTSLKDQVGAQGGMTTSPMSEAMLKFLPDWGAYWLRFEGDAIVLEATAPKPAATLGPTEDRASDVAKHVPASAIALAVTHDVGDTLQKTLEIYKAEPSLKQFTGPLDQGLGALGGAETVVGWIGDTGLVVNRTGDTVEGGLVILPTDPAAATRFFASIKNIAALTGVSGVTFRDEDYAGTTITTATIDVPNLGNAAAGVGAMLPAGKVEIAWATTDDVVVIGSGPEFVKHVLDTTNASSLASNDRYKGLIARVGDGTASAFVDIAAIRDLAETHAKAADPSALKSYDTDVKPFLAPFDALVASGSVGGDVTRSKVIITVK